MKVNDYVYQFAIRRASDVKKQFVIETDTIYSEEKLTKEDLMQLSEKYECDVQITYLGKLVPPKKEEIISVEYHSKETIEQKLTQWHNEKEAEKFDNPLGVGEMCKILKEMEEKEMEKEYEQSV